LERPLQSHPGRRRSPIQIVVVHLLFNRLKTKLSHIEQAIYDARASVELTRLGLPYLPWPASAIAPSALMSILNELQINHRNTVVEFGSGLSTIYMAKVLKQRGGYVTSIEHDSGWAALVQEWINRSGLEQVARIVVAPLASCPSALEGNQWYDQNIVAKAIASLEIDCVLVDGPPAYAPGAQLARYPAFEAVKSHLGTERHVIFLDDIGRPGEQAIVKRWSAQSGLTFEMMPARGGIARAVKGPAYHSAI